MYPYFLGLLLQCLIGTMYQHTYHPLFYIYILNVVKPFSFILSVIYLLRNYAKVKVTPVRVFVFLPTCFSRGFHNSLALILYHRVITVAIHRRINLVFWFYDICIYLYACPYNGWHHSYTPACFILSTLLCSMLSVTVRLEEKKCSVEHHIFPMTELDCSTHVENVTFYNMHFSLYKSVSESSTVTLLQYAFDPSSNYC